jgi:uracil-DNA glycosylase
MFHIIELTIDNPRIKKSWKTMFQEFINISQLNKKYKKCLDDINIILDKQINKELKIYPEKDKIFHAFEYFELSECNIVILGQDPYHQYGQATGLAFSIPDNCKMPPSLINIYKEIINDNKCSKNKLPNSGNLTYLAKQGVLLLNTTLTVEDSKPNIHSKYWSLFTDFIIKWISDNANNEIIFMLWGNNAKKKSSLINKDKHNILEANHPSPLSANRGGWFGCGHFGMTSHLVNW